MAKTWINPDSNRLSVSSPRQGMPFAVVEKFQSSMSILRKRLSQTSSIIF